MRPVLPFLYLLLLLVPRSSSGLELIRGPYIQSTGTTESTVVFRTDSPCDGQIYWGLDRENFSFNQSMTSSELDHVARLRNLNPSTRYYYDVLCDGLRITAGTRGSDRWFETAPLTGSNQPFRAWVVGDSGTGGFPQKAVRDAALRHWGEDPPDLFLHMGDMAYGSGTESQFTLVFFGIYTDLLRNVATFPTLGNHEGSSSTSATQEGPYYDAYVLPTDGRLGGVASGTEAWYSYDWANVHFVVLDSHDSSRDPKGPMLGWLEEDLQATDQDWIIAYWHHPPYTRGSHNSDYERSHIDMRENALPILEAGGVDLVLGGHSHIYERSYLVQGGYETPSTSQAILDEGDGRNTGDGPYALERGLATGDGSLYVVAGHGGANPGQSGLHPLHYFAEPEYGSVLIDVHANRLSLRNVRDNDIVSDRVTMIKGAGIDVAWPDGAEVLVPGMEPLIRWGQVGMEGRARLEWSCNNGLTWSPIGDIALEDGAAPWTVPPIRTEHALVRLTPEDQPNQWDQSDGRFAITDSVETHPLPWRSRWRYLDDGTFPGRAWNLPRFDDDSWRRGAAQLGYGNNEDTRLTSSPVQPTTLFRRTFTLHDAPNTATVSLLFDDGIAVWINGELFYSEAVDNGLGFDKWASATGEDDHTVVRNGAEAWMVPGENTIAVMVKQAGPESTSMSFDLQVATSYSSAEPLEPCPLELPGDDDDDSASADVPPGCSCSTGGSAFLPLLLLGGVTARRWRAS